MKRYIVVFCVMLTTSIAFAQFEGQIDMKMTRGSGDDKRETQLSMFIKQGMLSFSVAGKESEEMGGNIIFRSDKNLLWIVNDKAKTYMEIVPDKEMVKSKKENKKEQHGHSALRKTGKSVTIAGYSCDEWVAEDEEEVTTIAGTTKLGNVYEGFRKAFAQWGGQNFEKETEGWQRELIEKQVFPMKTVTKGRNEITEAQEVTKVEKRSLSTSLFELPPGFKKQSLDLDMGKMMKGLKSGNGRAMSKDDLEKLMKQLKGSMKDTEEKEDSTDKADEDDDE
jgi:hypothetical protein